MRKLDRDKLFSSETMRSEYMTPCDVPEMLIRKAEPKEVFAEEANYVRNLEPLLVVMTARHREFESTFSGKHGQCEKAGMFSGSATSEASCEGGERQQSTAMCKASGAEYGEMSSD